MTRQDRGFFWSGAGTGTTIAGFTQAGTANGVWYVTDFAASSQTITGTFTIYTGIATGGSQTLWAGYVASGGTALAYVSQSFGTPLVGRPGQAVQIIANGGGNTYVNMSGFGIISAPNPGNV